MKAEDENTVGMSAPVERPIPQMSKEEAENIQLKSQIAKLNESVSKLSEDVRKAKRQTRDAEDARSATLNAARDAIVFEATLIPSQIHRDFVRLDVVSSPRPSSAPWLQQSTLTFNRNLLAEDYEQSENAMFKLVITRV